MIVIYTGDIKRKQVAVQYNIGAVKISIEPAFLSELDWEGLLSKLTNKIMGNQKLTRLGSGNDSADNIELFMEECFLGYRVKDTRHLIEKVIRILLLFKGDWLGIHSYLMER